MFRVIGECVVKVKVLADTTPQEIFSYVDNVYMSAKEFTFNINNSTWFNSACAVELHACKKTVTLKIECISGKVYIDAVHYEQDEYGNEYKKHIKKIKKEIKRIGKDKK